MNELTDADAGIDDLSRRATIADSPASQIFRRLSKLSLPPKPATSTDILRLLWRIQDLEWKGQMDKRRAEIQDGLLDSMSDLIDIALDRISTQDRRIETLEHRLQDPSRKPKPKRDRKPKPYVNRPQAEIDQHWNLFAPVSADPRYFGLPPSIAIELFAIHNGLSPREFARWFQKRNTHKAGSPQELNYMRRISEALVALPKPELPAPDPAR